MTIRATKFTPSVLLSAPRRSAGIPNSTASKVLYTISTYSFATHKKTTEVRVLDFRTKQSTVLREGNNSGEACWVDDENVLITVEGEETGETEVWVGPIEGWENGAYIAATIDASIGSLKLKKLDESKYAIAFSASATPEGNLHNPKRAKKPHATGQLYTSLFVRHWDTYIVPSRNAIWYGTFSKKPGSGKYAIQTAKLVNALKDSGLESPIPPFGGSDNFDLSASGIIFVAKDPDIDPAANTKVNVYMVTIPDFSSASAKSPEKIEVYGFEGASTSPVFSSDGKKAAFLAMKMNGYESDKNHIFVIPDVERPSWVVNMVQNPQWDRSPQSVVFSLDAKTLYIVAESHAVVGLYSLPVDIAEGVVPQPVMQQGSVTDVRILPFGYVFISSTSLIDNSLYSLYSPFREGLPTPISSNSRNGSLFGLSSWQVSSIYWPGAAPGTQVHALVVRPSTFKPENKYPLAYLIHGGPQGAWTDGWSTRWNPAVFAEQGYIVVCPNPTGSTGYGQAFTDAIRLQWGGLPYQDLAKGFEWIEQNLDYVDTERAVALGASYGGYMVNWIQGQPLGRRFKALVCHDGVFSVINQISTDELYFPFHEFGGRFWTSPAVRAEWEKWDPSRFTGNWATPELVIHSEKDFRLGISEGLAAFNVLQAKGVKSQLLVFPDENHWVLNPENSLMWHRTVLSWINKHVGLPPPDLGECEEGEGQEEWKLEQV